MANARIKENILNQADKLPHEQYNLYVIQKIERGLKDEEAKSKKGTDLFIFLYQETVNNTFNESLIF